MLEPGAEVREVWQTATPDLREVAIILLSLLLLIIGTFISLISEQRVGDFIGNHLAGLGVVGLFASLTAYIAVRKGRRYRTAFLMGSLLPMTLGLAVVLVVFILTPFVYCGGGVVLLTAMIVPIVYACLRKRPVEERERSPADQQVSA